MKTIKIEDRTRSRLLEISEYQCNFQEVIDSFQKFAEENPRAKGRICLPKVPTGVLGVKYHRPISHKQIKAEEICLKPGDFILVLNRAGSKLEQCGQVIRIDTINQDVSALRIIAVLTCQDW